MPFIQCLVQAGLGDAKKQELALQIAKDVHAAIGAPIPYIHVAVSEVPKNEFVESGVADFAYGPTA